MTGLQFSDDQGLEDNSSDADRQGFVICYLNQLEKLVDLIKDRTLRPRDAGLLFALLTFYNPRTGLCHVSATHLAEVMGVRLSEISSGISRLKKNLIAATYVDKVSGQKSILLNPFMFVSGGASKRAFLQTRFMKLVND